MTDALYCCQCPAAFISLLCSRATTQTKNNSKNAAVIAMPSACNVANIVVWPCSIDPIARSSLLCSWAVAACSVAGPPHRLKEVRKGGDEPNELTGTNACRDLVGVGVGVLGGMCNALTKS